MSGASWIPSRLKETAMNELEPTDLMSWEWIYCSLPTGEVWIQFVLPCLRCWSIPTVLQVEQSQTNVHCQHLHMNRLVWEYWQYCCLFITGKNTLILIEFILNKSFSCISIAIIVLPFDRKVLRIAGSFVYHDNKSLACMWRNTKIKNNAKTL